MVEPLADREVHRSRSPVLGQTIYDFRHPTRDWALSRLAVAPWPKGAKVLDAGCGTGAYLDATRRLTGPKGHVIGLDIGHERAAAAPSDAPAVGDAQALPCRTAAFDVVLAMHMLYHVPDIPLALAEFRRVLRSGGHLIASTNSSRDEPELLDLLVGAGVVDDFAFGDTRFCSENAGSLLATAFDRVDTHDEASTLIVPDPSPLVRSVDSMRYVLESQLRDGIDWGAFLTAVETAIRDHIQMKGSFDITCHSTVLVCS